MDAAERTNKIARNSANTQTRRANAECMVGLRPRVYETGISFQNLPTWSLFDGLLLKPNILISTELRVRFGGVKFGFHGSSKSLDSFIK